MSNGAFIGIIFLGMFIAWSVYLASDRTGRWAFPLWFPLTASSAIGTLVWLFALLAMFAPVNSDAAGWAKLGAYLTLGFLLPSPILLFISWQHRPHSSAYSPYIIMATVAGYIMAAVTGYIALVGAVIAAPSVPDRVPIHLHLVTVDEQPVVGAKINFQTYSKGGGYSPSIEAEVTTDNAGHALLHTRRMHLLHAVVKKTGFSYTSFEIGPSYSFGFHPTSVSWQGAKATDHYQDNQYAAVKVPDGKELSVKLFLPRKGVDTWLPYPPK